MGDRVIVIAQARMGSSRLPGKVLRRAGGETLLWHLATRLKRAETASVTVLATTVAPEDAPLEAAARELGLVVHRGPVDDVLGRYIGALDALQADDDEVVVRVTGDCPALDPEELDRLVFEFLERAGGPNHVDYLTNQAGHSRRIPHGLDVEVFWAGALRRAHQQTQRQGDREHVTPYLYRVDGGAFKTAVSAPDSRDLSYLRLTVDEPRDLEVMDAVFKALGPTPTTLAIAAWLDANPEVLSINATVPQRSIASEDERRSVAIDGKLLLARADAGGTIGFGHVARVSALLEAWIELGGRATIVGLGIQGGALKRLDAMGASVVHGSDHAFQARIDDAFALVIDGYTFNRQSHLAWACKGRPLVAIDDMAEFAPVADVVVNQNLDFDAGRYGATNSRLLVGSPYVLLRSEFRRGPSLNPSAVTTDSARGARVLMSFGGSDPAGLTGPVARELVDRLPPSVGLDIVLGAGVQGRARSDVHHVGAQHPQRVAIHEDVVHMATLLRSASLALVAAGSTVWECMACSTPVALVAVATNQSVVMEGVARHDAGVALGWHETVSAADIAEHVASLVPLTRRLDQLAERGRQLVDGRGVLRVIDAIIDAAISRQQE